MKRYLYVCLILIFCFFICGCTASKENEKTLVRAELNGWGEKVILETDEELQELQSIMDSIEYSVHEYRRDALGPGSQSLIVRMEFSGGESEVVTLPCNVIGEKVYVAPEAMSLIADAFF